jgi:hypothetical protein
MSELMTAVPVAVMEGEELSVVTTGTGRWLTGAGRAARGRSAASGAAG